MILLIKFYTLNLSFSTCFYQFYCSSLLQIYIIYHLWYQNLQLSLTLYEYSKWLWYYRKYSSLWSKKWILTLSSGTVLWMFSNGKQLWSFLFVCFRLQALRLELWGMLVWEQMQLNPKCLWAWSWFLSLQKPSDFMAWLSPLFFHSEDVDG